MEPIGQNFIKGSMITIPNGKVILRFNREGDLIDAFSANGPGYHKTPEFPGEYKGITIP